MFVFPRPVKALQLDGDSVAGRKVQVIVKDDTGSTPDMTKRLAQKLVVKENRCRSRRRRR
ncbi:hypothetical protein VH569_33985 [Azospirillum sp. 11R-A]|uniref:hypothetical protein n=1 Tax=Azospirillum sp. 11R-A TaxID=3111634 RepID=UPI003C1533D5